MPSTTMLPMSTSLLSVRLLPLQPVLRSTLEGLQEIKRQALELGRDPDREAFNRQPNSQGWSAAQCIEHLNLAGYEMALPTIEELIAVTAERGLLPRSDYRNGQLGEWFIRTCEPTSRRRFRTFKRFESAAQLEVDETIGRFLRLQDLLVEQLHKADRLDLGSMKARNAAMVPLNLNQWFRFTVAHELLHLAQGRRALDRGCP